MSTTIPAFVFGNGESRVMFDPHKINELGTTYGCNAIYRDFLPDYLIAVDPNMIQEIIYNNIQTKTKLVLDSRYKERYPDPEIIHLETHLPGQIDSGNIAALAAATANHKRVFLIGFDFVSRTGYQNNLYKSTQNYKPASEQHVLKHTEESWYNRALITALKFPKTKFYRVNSNNYIPPIDAPNYKNITIKDFLKRFPDVLSNTAYSPEDFDYTPQTQEPTESKVKPSPFKIGPPKQFKPSPF